MELLTAPYLEAFVDEYLRKDLKDLEHRLNVTNKEIEEFLDLKKMIETSRESIKNGTFRTQLNIGNNMFMQAKVDATETMLVNVGKDYWLELTLDEALQFVDRQIKVLSREADVVRDASVRKRAEIKLTLLYLGEKEQLHLQRK